MYGFIYKIVVINKDSNLYEKFYIGQHKSKSLDDGYICSGLIINQYLYKHFGFKHYLRKNKSYEQVGLKREIVCLCETKEELNTKEIYYISKHINDKKCLNQSKGGDGILGLSDEIEHKRLKNLAKARSSKSSREKTSKRSKENWKKESYQELQYLHHNSKESKEKWRNASKKVWANEEFKKKHSVATKNGMNKPEVKKKMYETMHTKEFHEKISNRCKEFYKNNDKLKNQIAEKVSNYWKNMTKDEYEKRIKAIKDGMKRKKEEQNDVSTKI